MRNSSWMAIFIAAIVLSLVLSLIPRACVAADADLEAQVQARAQRVAALRHDYDQAVDELEKEPALSRMAQTKAHYALLQYGLLLDAQGHQQDAQRLRDAQRKLMEQTQIIIAPILHELPAFTRLQDLGKQIAAVDDDYGDVRKRVATIAAAAREVSDVGGRLASLKQRQAELENLATRLKTRVAAQTDQALQTRNLGLLAKADELLARGRAQIQELQASSAEANARLTAISGETDLAAASENARKIAAEWNQASRLRDEAGDLLWGLRDLSTSITASGSGSVSRHTADGRDIPLDMHKPVEILPGDTLRTGTNADIRIRLIDGSIIALRENSVFTFRGVDRDDVLSGGAMHRFHRLLNHLMKDPPRRNTPTAAIAERGTDYVVFADDAQTACAVFSGEVEVTPTDPSIKPMVVKALQRATLKKDGWTVETITAEDYQRIVASFGADVR